MHRHLTPGEKRAQERGRAAAARAQAIAARRATPDHDDNPWPTWPPTPAAWRARCRQIRQEAEQETR